ncbi:lamin tail domain-containing protein [Myxococcota bacterium]|nr:lamin tail domain-containing protein [Myxococcota bacterium]MBU1897696.1 lamin tail domain-containing protein [Myxococcota bacterium]
MSYEGLINGVLAPFVIPIPVTEGGAHAGTDTGDGVALYRCDGVDTNNNGDDFRAGAPTPGARNDCPMPLACPDSDDMYEENDDLASPAQLPLDGAEAIVCAGDSDFFIIEGFARCEFTITTDFTHGNGDVDIYLYDDQGNELSSSVGLGDREEIVYAVAQDMNLIVEVALAGNSEGNTYTLTSQANCLPPSGRLVINEVDYDQPGADGGEFVEIFNSGDAPVALAGLLFEAVNANGEVTYSTALDVAGAVELGAGEYMLLGTAAAIAAAPVGTPSIEFPAYTLGNLHAGVHIYNPGVHETLDAMSYEGVIDGVTEGLESAPTDAGTAAGLSRCPNGADTDTNALDFTLQALTPGAANTCL